MAPLLPERRATRIRLLLHPAERKTAMTDQRKTPVQNTPTPAQKAMKQASRTPAERGDIVGPNDGPATPRRNQPVRPGDAGVGESRNQGSSPYQDRSRPDKPQRGQSDD